MLARFLAGLPHGAYFGVASLVAASMARPEREGRAVATVMLGLSVANVVGVPAATWLGQNLGWRSAFWTVAVLGLVTSRSCWPSCRPARRPRGHRPPRARRAQSSRRCWLTLLAGAVGFGGMFAVYTYIAPTVTEVGGLSESRPCRSSCWPSASAWSSAPGWPGRWPTGRCFRSLFDRCRSGMGALLLAFCARGARRLVALPGASSRSPSLGSVLVVNLQLRLMEVAGDAQTLGAALNHASLNVANALGAWLGGLVIAAGWGYRAPALVGVGLARGPRGARPLGRRPST